MSFPFPPFPNLTLFLLPVNILRFTRSPRPRSTRRSLVPRCRCCRRCLCLCLPLVLFPKPFHLPFHSYCQRALLVPVTHVDEPPDPVFVPCLWPISSSSCSSSSVSLLDLPPRKTILHPLLLAQIRSIRPELLTRPYVDWFRTPIDTGPALTRLSCPASAQPSDSFNPWTTLWSPDFHSLILTLPSLTEHVVPKLMRDASTGTLIVPASQLSIASLITRVASYIVAFATGGVDLIAIIWGLGTHDSGSHSPCSFISS